MVDRKYWNWKIIVLIWCLIYKYPDLRFCQILSILDLDRDRFYEEPDETYSKLKEGVSTKNL